MEKIYLELTDDQKERGIIFSSTLSTNTEELIDDTTHELTGKEEDFEIIKERLLNDSFFRNSHFKYNIIRTN